MTIKQFLASIGITNLDSDIKTEEPKPEPKPETKPEQEKEKKEEPDTVSKGGTDSSINEQTKLSELQKQIDELKATNARLMAQTPVEYQPTAKDALLELLGIGEGEDGTE